jgi:hypothetical protein
MLGVSKARRVSVFTSGIAESRSLFAKGMHVTPAWEWSDQLNAAYFARGRHAPETLADETLGAIRAALREIRPHVLVLHNDSLFLLRAMIYVANSLGIPVLTIQHGLVMGDTEPQLMDGHYSDYLLAWSDYMRELYLDADIAHPSRIDVIGYPYAMLTLIEGSGPIRHVCMLGQPWELYDRSLAPRKREVLRNVYAACESRGLNLVYRPHPTESRAELQEAAMPALLTPSSESLREAFNRYDVFVSINSTALIEAALRKRRALQVFERAFSTDDFAAIGACKSAINSRAGTEDTLSKFKDGSWGAELPQREFYRRAA